MDNDLISREALKKAFREWTGDGDSDTLVYAHTIYSLIDNAPTVHDTINVYPSGEVIVQEKRPKAKWIWRETGTSICRYGYFTCSNCSFVSKAKQNFCAECGADMRGEKNGQ